MGSLSSIKVDFRKKSNFLDSLSRFDASVLRLTHPYLNILPKPTEKISCNDPNFDLYYLPFKKCDGYWDCVNGADELYDECGTTGK